jgi:hypothetical protein
MQLDNLTQAIRDQFFEWIFNIIHLIRFEILFSFIIITYGYKDLIFISVFFRMKCCGQN